MFDESTTSNINSFFVISAKNEFDQIVFLQIVYSYHVEHWEKNVNEYTYRFSTRKEAKQIMDIQTKHFPERNKNLAAFKIKQVRPVLTIK